MKPWMRTALAVVLVLAIAAGGFFLPNLVAARLDRADQDTAFSLSTGDEQGPATVLRRKLTDGMQNLFYGAEEPVELDESAAAHTLAEMTQYAQELLGALEKDSALFGGGFSVEEGATVQYASYGSGFVLWGIALSNPRGDTASFLLDDATGCVLALSYTFSDSYSIVFQDVMLFDETVMENIRLGRGNATDEEVMAAARAAQCEEFIQRLPHGYQTNIGENGSALSGGERQRISIARALLKDAPIVLLDEATASMDAESETLVQDALSVLLKDKTVMVIAHRMRTVANADKIVVLDDGKVSETGTPAELMEKGGLYAHLVELQQGK